uniref:Uncharacterized protein n=2 Tax=Meloidogyne TaxID=189290 RepID=A0A6V7TIQ8_MELEN|nr:unnamed protein product [Meloidogyne enterolobii]
MFFLSLRGFVADFLACLLVMIFLPSFINKNGGNVWRVLKGSKTLLLVYLKGADFISSIWSKTSFYLKIVAAVVVYLCVYSIGLYIYLSFSNVENVNISWNYNGYGSSGPFKQIIATQNELIDNNTIFDLFPEKLFKLV